MPELPEVETVVRTLEHQLGHSKILSTKVLWANMLGNCSVEQFESSLVNQSFEQYNRKGKYLIFTLTDYVLVVHLRMEGKFYIYSDSPELNKHTHIIFQLNCGQLHYNDVRKFGRFYLYKKGEPLACLDKLGLEPFDENLTGSYCRKYCSNIKTPIKSQLLDQGMIAGIGNIYADEICYASRLNPYTPSCFISLEKWDEIIRNTQQILSDAIKSGGTTIRSYTSSLGVTGLFQLSLKVHARKDQCDECGSQISKTRIGGRGTYYCPNCQRKKPVVVSITGTIGSGKSTVTELIQTKGYQTISCDAINSELLARTETIKDLAVILKTDETKVDRKFISNAIFNHPEIKKEVETYLHKKIHQHIQQWIDENKNEQILFVEVPLLFEVNWDYFSDFNILVIAQEETVYSRLMKNRQMSYEEVTQRIRNQFSVEEKKKRADYIIENDETIQLLERKVEKLLSHLTNGLNQ